jgi:hypothetical protein
MVSACSLKGHEFAHNRGGDGSSRRRYGVV